MPILPVPETNVLIMNEIGKNVSGGGMDPHIVWRFVNRAKRGGIASRRIIVLYITEEFKGSGIGIGRTDFPTQRAFEKFDFEQTDLNALTSNVLELRCIPIILANDRLAIAAPIKTYTGVDKRNIRMVRIRNSLEIEKLCITADIIGIALDSGKIKILRSPASLPFDVNGGLIRCLF